MKVYNELIHHKRQIETDILIEKEKLHQKYYRNHKVWFRILDITLIAMLVLNFASITMTNALVIKKEPQTQLYEVNPVNAERGGFEVHPQAKKEVSLFFSQAVLWVVIVMGYIFQRNRVINHPQMVFLVALAVYLGYVVGHSFFNDLGYYIGNLIWG